MREILFRGINHETGKFVYGFYTKLLDGARITHNIIVEDEESEYRFTQFYIHNKETIGQYTGLKDKNGKKIFEGDIISNRESYSELLTDMDQTWEIHFDDNNGQWELPRGRSLSLQVIDKYVIGNIHEADK